MFRKVLLILLPIVLLVGCYQAPREVVPILEKVPLYTIPPNFTTYTLEGVFEISYPNDWSIAPSEVEQWNVQDWESQVGGTPGIESGEAQLLLSVGKPHGDYYWENLLGIGSDLVPTFWTLEDFVEGRGIWNRDAFPNYQELSKTKITILSGDAIVVEETYTWPSYGPIWSLTLYTIKGNTVWEVNCLTDLETLTHYESTFWSVLRSFQAW